MEDGLIAENDLFIVHDVIWELKPSPDVTGQAWSAPADPRFGAWRLDRLQGLFRAVESHERERLRPAAARHRRDSRGVSRVRE